MAKRQFKTESKRVLELMINSIYTNREIFLRELISNASDAIDKRYFRSLTDESARADRFEIRISADHENRILTISDNGCGMTKEDLADNLGVIAKSGTLSFKRENENNDDVNMIGQFGVGFYSAFMVAKKVTVISRALDAEEAFKWESSGVDGYTIDKAVKESVGTDVILELKDNADEEEYDTFLSQYQLETLVKRYSDYIRYPIVMNVTKTRKKEGQIPEGEEEYESYIEEKTLNSMVPIWRRNKSELKEEDYNEFYRQTFFDYTAPLSHIHTSAEGSVCYKALLYIPGKEPYNYYSKDYEKGLRLYSDGVLIMEKCAELLPDYFSFVKGCVDTSDLSLNISRETLQQNRQLRFIANNLERKIKGELENMMKNDREKYERFFNSFGIQFKYCICADFGMKKDVLKDMLLFMSLDKGKMVSLAEYREAMPEDQKYIYYANGSRERVGQLPQAELVMEKGFDILCVSEDVDEFALKTLAEYEGKEFRSVSADDIGIEVEEEAPAEESKELLEQIAAVLDGKVKKVKLSTRLRQRPVCLATEGMLSIEMEKVMNAAPGANSVHAERVLELNPAHPVFRKLSALKEAGDDDTVSRYAEMLYAQAVLIEGLPLDDPSAFSQYVSELMAGEFAAKE